MNSLFEQTLDVRVAFEKASLIGDEVAGYESEIEAHIIGKEAQCAGQTDVPALFRNVPELNGAWTEGWHASINGGGWSRAEITTVEGACEWCGQHGRVSNFSEHNPDTFVCADCQQSVEKSWADQDKIKG